MNFITKRDLVETAEFAWTTRVRGSRRLRCGCGGSLTCGSLGGGGRGSIFEILGTLGTRKFFWKVVFSLVLGSRFFANSFFIVF